MDENNEISNQPELQVVGYCDSDGFLNKHCHGDYSEPVRLVAVAEEIIAQRDARIEEQAREIERLKADLDECDGGRWKLRTELAALKAQPSDNYFGEFSKGDTYTAGDDGKFEAGINHRTIDANDMVFDGKIVRTSSEPGTWFQRIVVYGSTAEQAKALRDVVLERIAQPSGVVLPECKTEPNPIWAAAPHVGRPLNAEEITEARAYNAALAEVARLNSSPASAGVGDGIADDTVAVQSHLNKYSSRTESAGGVDERSAFSAIDKKIAPELRRINEAFIAVSSSAACFCKTCKDSGVVSTTDKDHNGDHIEQRCPVCAGGVDGRAAFDDAWPSISADLPSHQRASYTASDIEQAEKEAALAGWQARAALNAGSAVPDGVDDRVRQLIAEKEEQFKNATPGGFTRHSLRHDIEMLESLLATAPTAKKEG